MSRLLLTFLTVLSIAAKPPRFVPVSESPSDEPQAAVASVLHAETEPLRPIDRRALLRDVLEQNPHAPSARWQAGYVRIADEWRPFEEAVETIQDDALRDQYRSLRSTAGQNTRDQVQLANWCRRNGLIEQERAHLTAALACSEAFDLPSIRNRLGYRLVNGRWMSPEEQQEVARYTREIEQSMRTWGHRLQNITKRLSGSRRSRESAIAELNAISDPSVLRAAELILMNCREAAAALEWVRFFTQFDRYQASQALARQAVFSRWPAVRNAATDALKSRRHEEFVPLLLAGMHRPAESRVEILYGPGGALRWTHVCAKEMADRWEVSRYSLKEFTIGIEVPREAWGSMTAILMLSEPRVRRANRFQNDVTRQVQDQLHRREVLLAEENERTEELNSRIATVIAEATGQPYTADPNDCWARWIDQTEMRPTRPKDVVVVSEEERLIPVPRLRPAHSCLVAGTPIWTDRGAVAVEQVRIGDFVLAKNVETGELAYKPVLLTTVREAPRIVRVAVGNESLELTSGHPVWVSGAGWTKASDLTSGQPLHTVTGTVSVDSVEPVGAGTVYNLVVADFHTYFFGESLVLSHDTTVQKLTNVVVPGLSPDDSPPE